MSLVEKSRENQAIVYRDSKDSSIVWDTLPSGFEADKLISERAGQGLTLAASGDRAEVLQVVYASQQRKESQAVSFFGNLIR